MNRIYYILIVVFIFCGVDAISQETVKKTPAKIEIRSNSRKQMVVTRDNQHRRRDLRSVKMNKKLQMSKKNRKALSNPNIQKDRPNSNEQNKALKRRALSNKQKKMLQKKRTRKQQVIRRQTR